MFRFFYVLTFYLPPIEDNRRLKKPRSCILRDRSLLQLTEVSHVFSFTNIGFVQRLSLGPLLSLYAYLCHVMLCYVMFTLPHKHLCHVIQYYALLLQLVFALHFISVDRYKN